MDFLAKICLLLGVVPDGSVILQRPSCSGKTLLGLTIELNVGLKGGDEDSFFNRIIREDIAEN